MYIIYKKKWTFGQAQTTIRSRKTRHGRSKGVANSRPVPNNSCGDSGMVAGYGSDFKKTWAMQNCSKINSTRSSLRTHHRASGYCFACLSAAKENKIASRYNGWPSTGGTVSRTGVGCSQISQRRKNNKHVGASSHLLPWWDFALADLIKSGWVWYKIT